MRCTVPILLVFGSASEGCIAERTIDQIIEEHGVTWSPASSEGGAVADASTSTSSSSAGSTTRAGDTSEASDGTGGSSDALTSSTGETGVESEGTSVVPDLPSEPICGDGIVDGDETCDDANDIPDDGCNACAKDSIIFVSSEYYQGGEIGGLVMADQRCRGLAAMAGLPRSETYRAWMSSQSVAARERLLHSKGRYVLVNGLVVANDWTSLTSGLLQRPIDVDEWSETQQSAVWTGTLPDGGVAEGSTQCDDWTDQSLGQSGGLGDSPSFNAWWSFAGQEDCGAYAAVYCVEQ